MGQFQGQFGTNVLSKEVLFLLVAKGDVEAERKGKIFIFPNNCRSALVSKQKLFGTFTRYTTRVVLCAKNFWDGQKKYGPVHAPGLKLNPYNAGHQKYYLCWSFTKLRAIPSAGPTVVSGSMAKIV